jgi:hypothetical protein
MLQRLHQPTAATVAAEYGNISKLTAFMTAVIANISKLTAFMTAVIASAPAGRSPTITLPQQQFAALMQRWCSIAKPLLLVIMDKDAIMRLHRMGTSAVTGAGMLLSLLGNGVECWAAAAAGEQAVLAVKQQIAQHTAGECVCHCPRARVVYGLGWIEGEGGWVRC